MKHFHHYLYGQEFVIRSDHGSLRWILNFRNTGEGQLARFLETLSACSFQLKYRAGRIHSNADAMSRQPYYADNCQYCARYEAKYQSNLTTHDNFDQSTEMKKLKVYGLVTLKEMNALRMVLHVSFRMTTTFVLNPKSQQMTLLLQKT